MLTNLSIENVKVKTAEGWVGVEAGNTFPVLAAKKQSILPNRCVSNKSCWLHLFLKENYASFVVFYQIFCIYSLHTNNLWTVLLPPSGDNFDKLQLCTWETSGEVTDFNNIFSDFMIKSEYFDNIMTVKCQHYKLHSCLNIHI